MRAANTEQSPLQQSDLERYGWEYAELTDYNLEGFRKKITPLYGDSPNALGLDSSTESGGGYMHIDTWHDSEGVERQVSCWYRALPAMWMFANQTSSRASACSKML